LCFLAVAVRPVSPICFQDLVTPYLGHFLGTMDVTTCLEHFF
jgi:hypothetical protein